MNQLSLSPRLKAIADMTGKAKIIADIGTDHAYLPAYLLQKGKAVKAYCSDIKIGPLQSASGTIRKFGLENAAEIFLSDGLSEYIVRSISPEVIVISGMGGLEIADILKEGCAFPSAVFILQPMNNVEYLRKWLWENGFRLEKEKAVCEGNKLYNIMKCSLGKENKKLNDRYVLLGEVDIKTPEGRKYLESQIRKYRKAYCGLVQSKNSADKLSVVENKLSVLERAEKGSENEAE